MYNVNFNVHYRLFHFLVGTSFQNNFIILL